MPVVSPTFVIGTNCTTTVDRTGKAMPRPRPARPPPAESGTAPGPGLRRSGLVGPGPRTVQVGSPLGAICTQERA